MNQLHLTFDSASKINTAQLSRQNRTIFDHLESGKTITTVSARETFSVYNLHSRISDLRNRSGVIIFDRMVRIGEYKCKEYSLTPFKPG